MARDPSNVHIWQDAHVYISDASTRPAMPTTISDPFLETDWPEVGILNGEDGFGEDRTVDEQKHYGWGLGLIKIGSKNFELMRKFSMLEDNETTRALVVPGSTTDKVPMPKPVMRWIAFETDSDLGERKRLFSTMKARIWVPSNSLTESDPTKWEVDCNLFSDGAGDVFDLQEGTPA